MAGNQLLGHLVRSVPEEIPELNALNDSTELMVFAVNYDGQNGEALQSQAAEMGSPSPCSSRTRRRTGYERPRVLPTTLLVNPEGAVTDTLWALRPRKASWKCGGGHRVR